MPYPFSDKQCAEWYAKYPRKKAPANVEKAWAKLDPDAKQQALKTVEGFAKFWMRRLLDGDNIEYCPHPASYLNAGRHWDEPDPVAPPPPPSDFR
jgi:hypothetical protein